MNTQDFSKNYSKLKWVIDKATHDKSYRKNLINQTKETLNKEGILFDKHLVSCLENTEKEFHMIIPSFKMPEKLALKKLPKKPRLSDIQRYLTTQLQKSQAEKKLILENPSKYLLDHGAKLPKHLKIIIHEITPSHTYIVLPRIPEDGLELNPLELESIAGGGFFDDVGNFFSDAASSVASGVTTAASAVGSGVSTAVNRTITNQTFISTVTEAAESFDQGMTSGEDE